MRHIISSSDLGAEPLDRASGGVEGVDSRLMIMPVVGGVLEKDQAMLSHLVGFFPKSIFGTEMGLTVALHRRKGLPITGG
jgi:hypothetical protein